jgi:hypothetical protein
MIKKFDEFVNEGLLDIFSGDGCKNLETICSAFSKRLSKLAPIKFKHKLEDGKIINNTLDYSSLLTMEYISADDDLVIDRNGKRTIKEEAKRLAKQFKDATWASECWGDEEKCFKQITKYLYKTHDLNAFGNENKPAATALFTFTIPYLQLVDGEKDVYERKCYFYTTATSCKTRGRDDKEIATNLLNAAFYRLYKGLTDPEDKLIEFTDDTSTTFKDIRKFIPSELINVVKSATKRKDLNK